MNYIKRLEKEVGDLKANVVGADRAIDRFREHLDLDKFSGTDQDGARKDWIGTHDVLRWLTEIENELWAD